MTTPDAVTWLANNSQSVKYEGKWITTRLMEDKKGKKKLNFTPSVRPTALVRQSAPITSSGVISQFSYCSPYQWQRNEQSHHKDGWPV